MLLYFVIGIVGVILGWTVCSILVSGKIADLITENYMLIQKIKEVEAELKRIEDLKYEE